MKFKRLVVAGLCVVPLSAQEPKAVPVDVDPFSSTEAEEIVEEQNAHVLNISLCYEVFSLPLAVAAKLQRENAGDQEFYGKLLEGVDAETVKQEVFMMMRTRSGQKSTMESITEQIYPTEYEPAEMPNSVGVSITGPETEGADPVLMDVEKLEGAPEVGVVDGLKTSATGTAFETRNVGISVEAEATMSEDRKIVDLRIIPDHVAMVGRSAWGQDVSKVEMPTFETQSLSTAVTLRLNQPFLMGTVNLPPNSEVDPDSAKRVWFAFVTATLAKP